MIRLGKYSAVIHQDVQEILLHWLVTNSLIVASDSLRSNSSRAVMSSSTLISELSATTQNALMMIGYLSIRNALLAP